jgi:hypothetical protein
LSVGIPECVDRQIGPEAIMIVGHFSVTKTAQADVL